MSMQSTQGSHPTRKHALGRRAIVAGLATPFLPRFARAAEFTWRIGHSAPVDFPLHVRLIEAVGTIASRSGGQMAVEVYPSSELGTPIGLIAQLRAGTLDAAPLTNQVLATNLAVAALPMLGFAFTGYDQVWAAMDGGVGVFLRNQIEQRLGLFSMQRSWDFGFHQITTSAKTIGSVADLDGLRLRTPPEVDFIDLLQALKARPVTMPLSAMESALASGALDGQESVLPLVKAAALFKVQSRCALTNHIWDGQWLCVSGQSWAKLPAKLQEIVTAAFNESGLAHRQDTVSAASAARTELESQGMSFNATDPSAFRKALGTTGYYAAWQKKVGDAGWNALEKYTGRLA